MTNSQHTFLNDHLPEPPLNPEGACKSAFSLGANDLANCGYSPLPVRPQTKRPLLKDWQKCCAKPIDHNKQANLIRAGQYSLGVACGFNGLIGIDVDTEDPAIPELLQRHLPPATVVKRGAKGFTAFFRATEPIDNASVRGIVDVLSYGKCCVLPPSIHPDTAKPYQWITDATLFNTIIDELPEVSPGQIEAFIAAVKIRAGIASQDRAYHSPQKLNGRLAGSQSLSEGDRRRYEEYAAGALRNIAAELAHQLKGGRNDALFNAACSIGWAVHHGVLSEQDVNAALLPACSDNKLLQEDGRKACLATIDQGLEKSRTDDLPALQDRPIPNGNLNGHAAIPDEEELQRSNWPTLNEEALHGFAGRFAKMATEKSEVDIVAVLVTLLTYIGVCVGRLPTLFVGDTEHHCRIFALIIGATGKSRKGMSEGAVKRLFMVAHRLLGGTPGYGHGELQVQRGLATGEGLAHAIRDADPNKEDDKGAPDKRLMIIESEFATVTKQARRQGNILSPTLRNAWDGNQIGALTKSDRSICKKPHVGVVAHTTSAELMAEISDTEIANGFLNRFQMFCVRRQRLVALPLPMDDEMLNAFAMELANILVAATKINRLQLSDEAAMLWELAYPELTRDRPGKVGMLTSRAEAHTLRLAATYAIADGCGTISEDHLRAALALWDYALQSICHLFETPAARAEMTRREKLEEALREGDLSRTQIRGIYHGNVRSKDITAMLDDLLAEGKICIYEGKATGGKSPTMVRWIHADL